MSRHMWMAKTRRCWRPSSLRCVSTDAKVMSAWRAASQVGSAEELEREMTAEEEQECLQMAPPVDCMTVEAASLSGSSHARAVEGLTRDGLLRMNGLLERAEAVALRQHAEALLEENIFAVARGTVPFLSRFGPVMARENRYDLLLPLDHVVLPLVQRVVSTVGPLLRDTVGAESCLCELSLLVSDPGAIAQPVHHDTTFDGSAPRVSILTALQDVTSDMGPTLLFPKTHNPEWHINLLARGEELEDLLTSSGHVRGTLDCGDAIAYDTTLLHCGSANESSRRMMLVVSAQEEDHEPRGFTNIRPEYRARFKITQSSTWQVPQ